MEPGTLFILEIRSLGVDVAATWNDIPVYSNPSGRGRIAQIKLNPQVVEGENQGRAILRPAEIVAEKGKAPGQPYLRLRVIRARIGQTDQSVLSEFSWRAEQGPLPPGWRASIPIGEAFGSWLWEAAPRIAPTAEDRQAILSLLERLRNALAAADAATVAEMFAAKNEEMARALDLPSADVAAAMDSFFAPFFGAAGRRMEPIDPVDIELAVQAQGRLIHVVHRDGGPALRGSTDSARIEVPVTVTRSGNQWVIVR